MMQKDQKLNLEEAVDTLKRAGIPEDEMAALERQLAPASTNLPANDRMVNFVSAGAESQPDSRSRLAANSEDIDLPEESDSDEENIEIAQRDVPAAVFGDLAQKAKQDDDKRDAAEDNENESKSQLGALERIKRQRRQ